MNLVKLALAMPTAERESIVRGGCSGDTELLRQAWRSVGWDERMQGFLLEPFYEPLAHEHPFGKGDLPLGKATFSTALPHWARNRTGRHGPGVRSLGRKV